MKLSDWVGQREVVDVGRSSASKTTLRDEDVVGTTPEGLEALQYLNGEL